MKVLISGYYGYGNIGDEAILAVMLEELRARWPDLEQIVVLSGPDRTVARGEGVRGIGRWNPFQFSRELRDTDAFMSGGGGLIQDQTSTRSACYYLGGISAASRRCPTFLVGQGIGPLGNRLAHIWARRLLPRVEMAMVRDEVSRRLLRRWGLPRDRILLGGDLALLLWPRWEAVRCSSPSWVEPSCPGQGVGGKVGRGADDDRGSRGQPSGEEGDRRGRAVSERAGADLGDRPCVAVSLKGRLSRPMRQAMASQLDRVSEQQDVRIVFVALHPREDKETMEAVADRMARPAMVLDPSGVSHEEVIRCLGAAVAVIGMRLHALIFSTLVGRPFIAISDDLKVRAYLRELERAGGPKIPRLTPEQIRDHHSDLGKEIARLLDSGASGAGRECLIQAGASLFERCREAMDDLLDGMEERAGLTEGAHGQAGGGPLSRSTPGGP